MATVFNGSSEYAKSLFNEEQAPTERQKEIQQPARIRPPDCQ
jgi:hypothetical protein